MITTKLPIDPSSPLHTGLHTGRLSSSNPNLQNIPIKTALGREIRDRYFGHDYYPPLMDWSLETRNLAYSMGSVTDVFGRVLRFTRSADSTQSDTPSGTPSGTL